MLPTLEEQANSPLHEFAPMLPVAPVHALAPTHEPAPIDAGSACATVAGTRGTATTPLAAARLSSKRHADRMPAIRAGVGAAIR
jgi:hypothetical protein